MATHFISRDGQPSLNMNDRVSALRVAHQAVSIGFQYDAATSTWAPMTTIVTGFQVGIDDNLTNPWYSAGISDSRIVANSIAITTTHKGGAFSITKPGIILNIGVMPYGNGRVFLDGDTGVVNKTTGTPAFPFVGGAQSDISAQFDDFWNVLSRGSFINVLPPGTNTQCSLYAGLALHMQSGMGLSNSPNISTPGRNDLAAATALGAPVFFDANEGNRGDYSPQAMSWTFNGNAASIARLPAVTAPADNSWFVVDALITCKFALVEFGQNDKGELTYEGFEEQDRAAIACYQSGYHG